MSQEQEKQLRRLVSEIRMMEGTAQVLEQRLQILNATIAELRLAQGSLGELRNVEQGSSLLVPVGGGVFMNASLGNIGKVIVGIGADVSVEMEYDKAVEDIGVRLQEMEQGSSLLVPVGGGVFMNASLGDIGKVIVGIGADVSVEMEYDKAVEDIGVRLQEMEQAQASVQEQMGQVLGQLETHNRMAERLSVEIQNAIQGAS